MLITKMFSCIYSNFFVPIFRCVHMLSIKRERQCFVSFQKAWRTLCGYVTKEDKRPYVWRQVPLNEILLEAKAFQSYKNLKTARNPNNQEKENPRIYAKLLECDDFLSLREDPNIFLGFSHEHDPCF